MSDDNFDELDALEDVDDPDRIRGDLMRLVRTKGVAVAYRTALAVAEDPKAMASARATAAVLLFRVAGFLEKQSTDDADKALHEMNGVELARHHAALKAKVDALDRKPSKSNSEPGGNRGHTSKTKRDVGGCFD